MWRRRQGVFLQRCAIFSWTLFRSVLPGIAIVLPLVLTLLTLFQYFCEHIEEVFSQYNKAVGLSKQKDFDALPNMFLNMLKTGAEIPLPVEIYIGSLLFMLVSGNREEFNKILADAPEIGRAPRSFSDFSVTASTSEGETFCQ